MIIAPSLNLGYLWVTTDLTALIVPCSCPLDGSNRHHTRSTCDTAGSVGLCGSLIALDWEETVAVSTARLSALPGQQSVMHSLSISSGSRSHSSPPYLAGLVTSLGVITVLNPATLPQAPLHLPFVSFPFFDLQFSTKCKFNKLQFFKIKDITFTCVCPHGLFVIVLQFTTLPFVFVGNTSFSKIAQLFAILSTVDLFESFYV